MQTAVTTMMHTPNGVELYTYDRTPYIYERKKVDAFGNERVDVIYSIAGRKAEFKFLYPNGYYIPIPIEVTNDYAYFKVEVYATMDAAKPIGIGHARRERNTEDKEYGSAFVELTETHAIGRALSHAGIGAGMYLDEKDADDSERNTSPVGAKKPDSTPDMQKIPGTEGEAMGIIITTIDTPDIHGKALSTIMAKTKNIGQMVELLDKLSEKGNPAEKAAAALILPKYKTAIQREQKPVEGGDTPTSGSKHTTSKKSDAKAASETPVQLEICGMSENEALAIIIETTDSESLKGQSFEAAIKTAQRRSPERFVDFLNVLIEKGNEDERKAATFFLPMFRKIIEEKNIA